MPSDRPIAFFLPDMRYGGAERIALRLIRSLAERGNPVDLVLMQKYGELLDHLPPQVRVIDLGARRIRGALRPLMRYLRDQRPRAIQARMWPLTVVAIIAAKLARVATRVVVSDHVTLSQQYGGSRTTLAALRATIRLIYPLAYARICVSEGVATDLSQLSGLPRDSFDIIYNPIEAPSKIETTADVEREWGAPGNRILTVGTLKDQKNHRLLLDAFAALPDDTARLMIVGDGPIREAIECHAANLGVGDRVIMAGSADDPWPYYASADLFVLSSDYEGFGNVIIEAMYAGSKVVSTDCPSGPAEILGDGKYGWLVPVGDCGRLSAAIQQALAAPADGKAVRARADALSGAAAVAAYDRLLLGDPAGKR